MISLIAEKVVLPLCSDTKDEPIVSLACAEVEGKSLLAWSIEGLHTAGLTRFIVLVGPQGERVEKALASLTSPDITVQIVYTQQWKKGDGAAVLEVEDHLDQGPFLLLNPTHLMSPELAEELAIWPLDNTPQNATTVLKASTDEGRKIYTDLHIIDRNFLATLKKMRNGTTLRIRDAVDKMLETGQMGTLETKEPHCLTIADVRDLSQAPAFLTNTGALSQIEENGGVGNPKRVLSYIEGILNEKKGLHYTLMNPGPVLTTARVKSAMVHHDICHRDEEFPKVVRRLRRKLKMVFGGGPEHEVILITGSGTSGMESAISSCVPEDKKVLVIANGAFGERFIEIAKQHRLRLETLHYEWGEAVKPEDLRRKLEEDPDIFAVAMCHHETSVGLINPIHEVGHVVRGYDRLFIVDSVASLGAEPLNVRKDKIDLCVSSANKCLHSTSGVATVCVSRRAWERMEAIHPRVYYLNLKRYRDYAVEKEETPFTPTVSGFFALDAAVDELLAEGVEGRIATYKKRNEKIRSRLAAMGLQFLSDTGRESRTVTCVEVPPYITFDEMYQEMKRRGYLIYNSKEHLKDRFFQVANMGDLPEETIEAFLSALEMVFLAAKSRFKALKANTVVTSGSREAQPALGA